MRIGEKSIKTAITVLGAFEVAIRKAGQINVRQENEQEIIEYIDMAINALENQSKIDQWIPCSERLPEEMQTVLIYMDTGWIDSGWRIKDSWWTGFTPDTKHDNVLAWQPLPAPYEVKSDE